MLAVKVIAVMSLAFSLTAATAETRPLTTVDTVDLQRYLGVWHEVARIPTSFQRKCVSDITATYSLRDDGNIAVLNQCRKADGSMNRAEAVARVVDKTSNAKLQVSFVSLLGIRLFWGDYWIIGLDSDYQWVVVGHPERKYGWILSRNTELTGAEKETVLKILAEKGYDAARFQWAGQKP